jgi:hypothetical protein
MNGTAARAAGGSTRLACRANSTPVATMVAAPMLLNARLRRLKKSRLQLPIMNMFHERNDKALRRSELKGNRSSRYPAAARPPSIPVQARGMIQSGGFEPGLF